MTATVMQYPPRGRTLELRHCRAPTVAALHRCSTGILFSREDFSKHERISFGCCCAALSPFRNVALYYSQLIDCNSPLIVCDFSYEALNHPRIGQPATNPSE